ncbi:hypothetical protein PG993_009257 [Apiospora rasikravindrae]|uniref:Ketoreductase domain-containing protein n=1 Tax=Apiospora rasikravindrae TaxID=990691 RepID=A0ABR1SIU9_9PEZI
MASFKGAPKVWLITGASRGLGFELARAALVAGHDVIACRRSDTSKDASAREITQLGGTWVQLDVGSENLEAQLADILQQHGNVDVLVNNAAHGLAGTIEDCSIEEINRIFRVNTLGPIRTVKAVIPSMRAQGSGAIVNISSSTGISAFPGVGTYAATKQALEGTTEALHAELAPFGIRVLLVEPGAMDTRFTDTSLENGTVEAPFSDCYKGSFAEKVAALRIVEAVDGTGMLEGKTVGLRLPLGKDTLELLRSKGREYTELGEDLREVAESIA